MPRRSLLSLAALILLTAFVNSGVQLVRGPSLARLTNDAKATIGTTPLLRSTDHRMAMRSITNAQRRAAAQRARARQRALRARLPKGAAARTSATNASEFPFAINPADLFFAGYPNYANSPRPVGSVGSITVTDGGSGYTSPTVTISDPYVVPATPAMATATLTGDGITSITLKTTSSQLPPGLLVCGNGYYFGISSVYEPNVDREIAPFRHNRPRGVAQGLSGVVTQ